MPNPYPNIFSGINEGMRMGLLANQQAQAQELEAKRQQAAEAEAKKAEFEQDTKKIDLLRKIQEDPNAADADKLSAYNALSPLIKKHHGFEMSPLDKWDTEYTKAAKRINAIWDNENYAPEDRLKLVRGVYNEVSQATAEKLKPQLEQAQKEAESGSFSRGMTLSRQIASTPELARSPVIMNEVLAEKERLLSGAGTKGQEVLAAGMKPEKDDATASLREFETVNGIRPEFRGTPQYKKMYEDWLKVKNPGAGSGQIVIMPTAEGFAAINKKTGTATPITGAGGESVNKPLTGEMITTQQQIGTVDDTFKRVKELYKPEFVGPIQGRAGAVRSATVGNPEDRATFYSALQDINNTLVYLKSGKQINEQEYERLKGAMPHRNLADSDFRARMIEFEKVFNSIISERQKNMGGYGKGSKPNLKQKYGLE